MTNGFSQCIEQTPSSGCLSSILHWLQHSTGLLTDELQAPSERLLHPLRYATFHPTLAAPIAQRLIGIRCFRLIKYTWLGGRGERLLHPWTPPAFEAASLVICRNSPRFFHHYPSVSHYRTEIYNLLPKAVCKTLAWNNVFSVRVCWLLFVFFCETTPIKQKSLLRSMNSKTSL